MSDFGSQLSCFAEAIGYKAGSKKTKNKTNKSSTDNSSNGDNQKRENGDNHHNNKNNGGVEQTTSNLKQDLERLWRISQISRCTAVSSNKKGSSSGATDEKKEQEQRIINVHIAICAIVVDDLPHENIWKRWMETGQLDNDNCSDISPPLEQQQIEGTTHNDAASDNVVAAAVTKSLDTINDAASDSAPAATTTTTSNGSSGDDDGLPTTKISASAEMFVHAKHPDRIRSKWVREKTISQSSQPEWNDVKIIQAQLLLIKEALLDQKMTHISLCTDSCIPITSLHDAATLILKGIGSSSSSTDDSVVKKTKDSSSTPLMNLNRSFMNAYNGHGTQCTRFDERSCWSKLQQTIPYDAIHKSLPGWCLLSRKHAQAIIDMKTRYLYNTELYPLFTNVWAPEEVFFATALSLLGFLPGPDVELHALTHSEWPDKRDSRHWGRDGGDDTYYARAIDYDEEFHDVPGFVDGLVGGNRKCLFLRKMKYPIDLQTWEQNVLSMPRDDKRGKESSKEDRIRKVDHDEDEDEDEDGEESASKKRGRGGDHYDDYSRYDNRYHHDSSYHDNESQPTWRQGDSYDRQRRW